MSLEAPVERSTPPTRVDWETPSPPTDLVFDDGEPLESNRHRIAMNVLIDSILVAFENRTHYFVGGNMFVYYSRHQAMNRDFRGPDFFAVLDVDDSRERQGWVVWEEDGRYPNVIVELMSPSTAKTDRTIKKELYERIFRTAAYYIYDPFDPSSLEGWQLDASQRYQPIQANERGQLWCESLGLWLGTWKGQIRREPVSDSCDWLRFYTPDGDLVLLPDELAQIAQREAQVAQHRVEQLAARLRALGDPETV